MRLDNCDTTEYVDLRPKNVVPIGTPTYDPDTPLMLVQRDDVLVDVQVQKRLGLEQGSKHSVFMLAVDDSPAVEFDLNRWNHSLQRFPNVLEYEKVRASFCSTLEVR